MEYAIIIISMFILLIYSIIIIGSIGLIIWAITTRLREKKKEKNKLDKYKNY